MFDSIRQLFYEDDMLQFLCIYDSEQKRLNRTFMTRRTLFRCVFASMLVPCILGWGMFYPWVEFPQYLTNWGNMLVLISLCLSSYLPYD